MKRKYDATIGGFTGVDGVLPLASGNIMNPDHTLLSSSYLRFQKDLLLNIAKRIGFDFSMVTVSANKNSLEDSSELQYGKNLALSLSNAVCSCLRSTDLLFEASVGKQIFTILLPCADGNGANVVVNRVKDAVSVLKNKLLEDASFSYEIEEIYASKAA